MFRQTQLLKRSGTLRIKKEDLDLMCALVEPGIKATDQQTDPADLKCIFDCKVLSCLYATEMS